MNQSKYDELQLSAETFLKEKYLNLEGIMIYPKEIEVYYYEDSVFQDDSVHRNELQKNNLNHLYIHRFGKRATDSIKGRAGVDLCLSNKNDIYYTFLIRSAVINSELVVGPYNVLNKLKDYLDEHTIESLNCIVCEHHLSENNVYFSERLNLAPTVSDLYRNLMLRAVIDDCYFRTASYKFKETMVSSFVAEKYKNGLMSKDSVLEYSKAHLGYLTKKIKDL